MKIQIKLMVENIIKVPEDSNEPSLFGFLTVRSIETSNVEEGISLAVKTLMNEVFEKENILNKDNDESINVIVEEVIEIEEIPSSISGQLGLIWFPMKN